MITAQIFYKENSKSSLNTYLMDMILPMDNREFNKLIDENKLFSFENINREYFISISLNNITYKIICNNLMEANAVYFLTNEIEKIDLYEDLCIYSKYDLQLKNKLEVFAWDYINAVINIINTSKPEVLHEFAEDFKVHSDCLYAEYFVKSGRGYFFSGENTKYVFRRTDKMCELLEAETGLSWTLEDPSICANVEIVSDKHAYIPKNYYAEIKDDTEDNIFDQAELTIKVNNIEDIYDVIIEFEGNAYPIKYDSNFPIDFYQGNRWTEFHTVAHNYGEAISFIKKGLNYYKDKKKISENAYYDRTYENLKGEYSLKYRENHKRSDPEDLENELYGFMD